jgi:DNA replication protein DnaC
LFDIATNWISRRTWAHNTGRLEQDFKRRRRYKLLVLDEMGYLVFDHDAAKLFLRLVAAAMNRAPFWWLPTALGRWGELFSDDIAAAAMIDRLVHHAEVITLTGDSYRTRSRPELLRQGAPGRDQMNQKPP